MQTQKPLQANSDELTFPLVLGCLESTGHATETLRHLAIVNELKLLYLSIFKKSKKVRCRTRVLITKELHTQV